MPWDTLHNIQSIHYDFLRHFLAASQLEASPASALPTFTFFAFAFILCHRILHRYTNPLTRFKVRLYREVGFQWSFFYIIRVWFYSIKGIKWITKWAEYNLKIQHAEGNFLWLDCTQVQASLFTVLTFIGMIPVTLVIMECFWKQTIPNFLMWVGEDPWVRSEIGISGHYLSRPPNFRPPKRKEYAYRSRRSISTEYTTSNPKPKQPLRNCKSLDIITSTNSINTFI